MSESVARIEKLHELQKEITEKNQKAYKLTESLKKSLKLQEFEPEAFKYGKCMTTVVGDIRHRPYEALFIIILGNGDRKLYPLLDTPFELWNKDAQEEFNTLPWYKKKVFLKRNPQTISAQDLSKD